ncbi:SseB family protein [Actinomadura sp. NPDC048021]|uniref:SseB family protein n=1 Tax=Actinomadura sp. NPDC048021 TaxID=3155385 RepID=UPI0033D27FAD
MATVADAWRPTSELEHRLQETVRAGDQESYFRLLGDADLVVPVPPDLVDGVLAGEAQPSWPTQEEDGRIHVLAYTSAAAMRACLGPSYQHFMTVRFGDIAETWPDDRWWLAVDVPARGVPAALPIEARLPSWFVRQVADGDGRPPQVGRASPPWEELRDQHRELPREAPRPEFQPANDVERELLRAAANNDHDLFLQTLAATDVLLPVPDDMDFSLRPGRPGFPWQTREVDGSTVVPVFTSPERLAEASGPGTEHIALPFTVVLRYWPDPDWLLAINSGSPAGGTVLAQQLPGLATWADQRAAQRMTDRFEPQNDIEQRLFDAARRRDTETFFKIILGAQVLVPVDAETPWGIVPGDPDFPWRPVRVHGRTSIQIFTSLRWMNEAIGTSRFIMPSLLEMVTAWPDASWTLVLNPGTPIDASMPGEQVRTLSGPPAPPSAATPPPPAAPSVPVAPAVPADPAASGPGRHAGPPVPDEPAVPAPVEPGRHHAGAPGGPAQPGLPEAVPPAPAHFGEAPAPRPADEPRAPLPGVPGEAARRLADPSSTAVDPGHMPGLEPAAAPSPSGEVAEPDPPGPGPAVPEDAGAPLGDARGTTSPTGGFAEPGLPPPASQNTGPLSAAPGDAGTPTPPGGTAEPGVPGPAPENSGPLDAKPGLPDDAGRPYTAAPSTTPSDTSGGVPEPSLPETSSQNPATPGNGPGAPNPSGGAVEPGLPRVVSQSTEPLSTGSGAPDDAGRPHTDAPAPGATTPSGGGAEPGLPGVVSQNIEQPNSGPGAPDDVSPHPGAANPIDGPPTRGPGSDAPAVTPHTAAPQGTGPFGAAPGFPGDAGVPGAAGSGVEPALPGAGIPGTEPPNTGTDAPGVPSNPPVPGPVPRGTESLGAAPGRDDAGRPYAAAPETAAEPGDKVGDAAVPNVPEGTDRRVAGPVTPRGAGSPADQGESSPTSGAVETGPAGVGATPGTPGEAEPHRAGTPTPPPGGLAAVPQDAAHPGQAEAGGGEDGAPAGERGAGRSLHAVEEPEPAFEPGNRIDQELYEAASGGDSDAFLRVLLNANVLVPIPDDAPLEVTPVQREFRWDAALRDAVSVQVFTSMVRLREVLPQSRFVYADFRELIGAWPREDWAMVLNPGTHIGASLHGDQVRSLSEWAVRVGLVQARPEVPLPPPRREPVPQAPTDPEDRVSSPAIMQKVVPHSHVSWYLEQGYDRVGGFVHSTNDVAELQTPSQLYEALGLLFPDSSFSLDDEGVYVIRWPAYCPDLYRVPFGGRDEEEMASWGESGWVIERPPFTGSGFAPGSAGSIREYKVTSVRLPYGAEMYYIGRDRSERFIAMYDPDRLAWLRPDAGAEAWDGRTEAAQ